MQPQTAPYIWRVPKRENREGNGTPLQSSCLENPMDGGAWWATVHGVTKSRTRLTWLSSSSGKREKLGMKHCHPEINFKTFHCLESIGKHRRDGRLKIKASTYIVFSLKIVRVGDNDQKITWREPYSLLLRSENKYIILYSSLRATGVL